MLGHLAFLAAAVPLASAQLGGGGPGPITRESTGCTSLSFTMPSWFVTDLAYSKATGDATFNLQNRASNFTASLACSGTAACTVKSSNPGGTVLAYLQVADESASVTVNQTWTCTDRTNVVVYEDASFPARASGKVRILLTDENSPPFVAVGNATVKLDCKDSSCTAVTSPLLVKASLLAPVSVTPSGAIGPTGHATPGCASKTPTWKLSDIYMDSDTKLNNDGRFNFLLTNVVTGYEASCFNQVMRQTTLSCVGNEFGSLGFDQYRISTVVSFNNETKNFTVTQSWFCDDVDQSKPYVPFCSLLVLMFPGSLPQTSQAPAALITSID